MKHQQGIRAGKRRLSRTAAPETSKPRKTVFEPAVSPPRLSPRSLHDRGLRQYHAGDFVQAAAALREALRCDPTRAGVWSDLGVIHASAGRPDDAMECYDRALALDPGQVDALNNKANALVARGRTADALLIYDRALSLHPAVEALHNNRGAALRELGRLAEALASFDRALALDPRYFDALNNRGNTLVELGRPAEALESYDKALGVEPARANTISNRGNALLKLRRPLEALAAYETAIDLNPRSAEAHNNRGSALAALDRHEEAIAAFEQALALRPHGVDALGNLANTLMALQRPADALGLYEAALRIEPNSAAVLFNRAQALMAVRDPARALASVDQALAIVPHDPDVHNVRGNALLALGRHVEALASYERALSLDPKSHLAHNNKGITLIQQGRFDEGHAALELAIFLEPRIGKSYYNLVQSKRVAADDPILNAMESLTRESSSLDPEDVTNLHFGLGKALADVADWEGSFHHLSIGNARKRAQCDYDEEIVLDNFARTREAYAREAMFRDVPAGNPSRLPVFVIGMPRSGSTLVEQILASHRDVHGAGEISAFDRAMARVGGPVAEALVHPEAVSRVTWDQFRDLGTHYLESLEAIAPTARRVVNKMLGNFRFAGLIALALPGACFIHARRDPVDTCFSCYSTLFTDNIPYSYDLGELGRYYRAYEAVMETWRRVLPPGAMLEIDYERVVVDLEGEARRIVDHCGLDWDPACLEFHRHGRVVRTASAAQVRRPLYTSSVGRWRAYERFLEPLLAEIGPRPRD